MNEPRWVNHDLIIAIQQQQIVEHGGIPGLRDRSLLESALNAPRQKFVYGKSVSVFDLAASYAVAVSQNHPFLDGNKRIALLSSAIFLDLNGYELNASEADTSIIFKALANGEMPESELSKWIELNSMQL